MGIVLNNVVKNDLASFNLTLFIVAHLLDSATYEAIQLDTLSPHNHQRKKISLCHDEPP